MALEEAPDHAALGPPDDGDVPERRRVVHQTEHAPRPFRHARSRAATVSGSGYRRVALPALTICPGSVRPTIAWTRLAAAMSLSRSIPVSTPIAPRQWTRASLETFAEAPDVKRHPPRTPMVESMCVPPHAIPPGMFEISMARVSSVYSSPSTSV